MPKLDRIDKRTCAVLREEANKALAASPAFAAMAEQFGLKFRFGNARYADRSFTLNLEMELTAPDPLFETMLSRYGLDPAKVVRGYKIVGYNPLKRYSKPWLLSKDGKEGYGADDRWVCHTFGGTMPKLHVEEADDLIASPTSDARGG